MTTAPAIPARKTSYAGVLMRSRLEADFAKRLDQAGHEWAYEPLVFAGPQGQWLPDFRHRWASTSESSGDPITYVELKPVSHLAMRPGERWKARIARIDELLSRMSMTWLTEPDARLALVWWEYGRGSRGLIHATAQKPWICHNVDIPALWPGLGQDAVPKPWAYG